ncbi:E3 ubiquitin-protein ligase rnf8-B-like [Aphelenchoides bicaudatus]|nr:E3 ubiquitin-protein ligase rnf8-B-like [Aphelenchoides bicaudatus]
MEQIQKLIDFGTNLKAKDLEGKSVLHICIENNNLELFLFFLRQPIDINAIDKNYQSCLHYAVEQDNLDLALILIDEGIDIKIRNFNGKTAVQLASQLKLIDMMGLLVDYGANIHSDNPEPSVDSDTISVICRICQERQINRVLINCGHTYCAFCITEWRQVSPTCPYCRAEVFQVLKLF